VDRVGEIFYILLIMKNLILTFVTATLLIGGFYSCTKTDETDLLGSPITEIKATVQNGILVFNTKEDMLSTKAKLSEMSFKDYSKFEDSIGFYSQGHLLDDIMRQEQSLVMEYYKNWNTLTEDQRLTMRQVEPHTTLYKAAESKGLIKIEEDSPEAHTYTLALSDPSMAKIVSLEGFVMINDTLWQFTNSQIKFSRECTINDKERLASVNSTIGASFVVFDMNSTDRSPSEVWMGLNVTGVCSNGCWNYSSGGGVRAKWYRLGLSCCNGVSAYNAHFIILQAQEHFFGAFRYMDWYTPKFMWDGTFDGFASCYYSNTPLAFPTNKVNIYSNQFTSATGVTKSPMVNRWYIGNNNSIELNPSGYFNSPPNGYWSDAFKMTQTNINGYLVNSFDLRDDL
jgi:hypothetical protein